MSVFRKFVGIIILTFFYLYLIANIKLYLVNPINRVIYVHKYIDTLRVSDCVVENGRRTTASSIRWHCSGGKVLER